MSGDLIMIRKFVEVPLFTRRWDEIGLGNEELKALQPELDGILFKEKSPLNFTVLPLGAV